MLAMHELDGRACDLDPRQVLRNVLARFAADGLTPVVACELEFYLLDARRTRDGGIRTAAWRPMAGCRSIARSMALIASISMVSFCAICGRRATRLGCRPGAAIGEYAAGQYEVTLAHKPDALARRR